MAEACWWHLPPQLVFGDKTILQPGMVLAVDGSVSVKKTFRAQVGDSFIVTENGYEPLTEFAKDLEDVVLTSWLSSYLFIATVVNTGEILFISWNQSEQ